jgi:hypothetical protein
VVAEPSDDVGDDQQQQGAAGLGGATATMARDDVGEVEEAQDLSQLTGRKKQLFELRLKMNKARKMNHSAVVAEKRRQEMPTKADANVAKKKRYEAAEHAKTAELVHPPPAHTPTHCPPSHTMRGLLEHSL